MANWQRKMVLNPEWRQAQEDEITIQELAAVVAKRLRAVADFPGDDADLNDSRNEIADEFDALAGDVDASRDDFDCVMQSLYDWGDQSIDGEWNGKKACWVDTMTQAVG